MIDREPSSSGQFPSQVRTPIGISRISNCLCCDFFSVCAFLLFFLYLIFSITSSFVIMSLYFHHFSLLPLFINLSLFSHFTSFFCSSFPPSFSFLHFIHLSFHPSVFAYLSLLIFMSVSRFSLLLSYLVMSLGFRFSASFPVPIFLLRFFYFLYPYHLFYILLLFFIHLSLLSSFILNFIVFNFLILFLHYCSVSISSLLLSSLFSLLS